ncbi:MAG: YbaK/EbsC family protein [Syntrophomonadaceae bacterium]|jgi:Cys-tRNA(Pro) deacylase|nr:YbaK/EbsC family protein [Syntrophomonadaceae bacterium]MDH7497755.1 YbaK/EbsC family protein [Syntrophomonadaceae bacterium]
MDVVARVQAYLDERMPGLRAMQLPADTSTAEAAAQALGVEVGQIAKTLLFKSKGCYLLVVAAGDVRMDLRQLKQVAGGKVRMASAEEVTELTGYPVGGVCPFALPRPLPVYLDESLKRYEVVFAAAGTANSALPITFAQLQQVTGGVPCRLAADT